MMKSLFTIDLDIDDYSLMTFNDFMRMFVIQMVVQILICLRHDKVELLSMVFIETTLFILLGILVYWLVFNYVITFRNKTSLQNDDYYQQVYSKPI